MSKSTNTNQQVAPTIPSFAAEARQVLKALQAFDAAASKASETIAKAMQHFLDSCTVAGIARSAEAVKPIGKAIRECEVFTEAVALGTLEKKTVTEYAQSAMRAYFHNVPFAQGLKNDPAFKIPDASGKTKGTPDKKSGGVKSTTREALDKTLSKAIQQARLLGLTDFAADVLDLALDTLDGFKEITE